MYINNVTHFLLEKIAEFIIEIEKKPQWCVLRRIENTVYDMSREKKGGKAEIKGWQEVGGGSTQMDTAHIQSYLTFFFQIYMYKTYIK